MGRPSGKDHHHRHWIDEQARPHAGGGEATLPVHAFAMAFLVVAGLSALSVFSFARLAPTAGDELAGRSQVRSRRFRQLRGQPPSCQSPALGS